MALPRTGETELVASQANAEARVNTMCRGVEQGASLYIIKDKDLTAPPGSPSDGDAYIVAATATGSWASQEKKIAHYQSGWRFITPIEGTEAYAQDENLKYRYDGSSWVSSSALAADIWTGTSATTFITPDSLFDAAAPQSLTSSTSITPNFGSGINFTLTLGHSGTLENPTNAKAGQSGVIKVTQDGTGSRTLAYGTNWKFPGGAPVLSTTAGAVDVIAYFCTTTSEVLAVLTKAYAA